MNEKIFAYHAKGATLDWSDKSAVIDYLVEGSKILCGSKNPFDEVRSRKLTVQDVTRATNLLSMFNHATLTLVIHGTEDKILTYEHGLALTKELPHATLLTIDGGGHEIHFNDWDIIIKAIFEHTSNN